MDRRVLLFLYICILALWLVPATAHAKPCGDNVQGRDIPCGCGDTVVSDLVLNDDPVAHSVCPGDGLIVRAPNAPSGVTIDLRGHTLRGSGHGTGMWIIYGGPGGARIVSAGRRARIDGFMNGLVAHGSNSVALIESIRIQRSALDGIRLNAPGYVVRNSVTVESGRDGFQLSGRKFEITNSKSLWSKRFGYFIAGADAVVGVAGAGDASLASGNAAFNLTGVGHRVIACMAAKAGKEGLLLNGMNHSIVGCIAQSNGTNGISGMGGDWWLADNLAVSNSKNGILVAGPHVQDGGGNSGTDNGTSQQNGTAMQCQIGGAPCSQ